MHVNGATHESLIERDDAFTGSQGSCRETFLLELLSRLAEKKI
jgi:hypothetical protein